MQSNLLHCNRQQLCNEPYAKVRLAITSHELMLTWLPCPVLHMEDIEKDVKIEGALVD